MNARSTSLHTTHNLLAYRPEMVSRAQPHAQLAKLEALRAACDRCLDYAAVGDLFATVEGVRLINAAHDLFEVDALYDFALDCDAPFGAMGK